MIRYTSDKQLKIEAFKSPFELSLNPKNRWVKLSNIISWDDLVKPYINKMSSKRGRPSVNPRVAIGSLIVKHFLKLSDEETISTIQENVYIQYFLGFDSYHSKPAFSPSLFVDIRKRMGVDEFNQYTDYIRGYVSKFEGNSIKPKDKVLNFGKLQSDASVCDQYIKYPTDLDLLNQAREWTEDIIDELYAAQNTKHTKPRTYRQLARKDWLNMSKKKRKTKKEIRKAIKKQLAYLNRNFKHIEKQLDSFSGAAIPLSHYLLRKYYVIQHVYSQQKEMYNANKQQCDDRIISISQPHVRPIPRGKSNRKTEFGAKINLGLENGIARIDRLDWNAFNEGGELISQVEAYHLIHGYYPELVQVDKIYATKANRDWLKERGIRITAEPLGRKPKPENIDKKEKTKRRKEYNERNQIEGKFGQGKNGYNLNKIRTRLARTSESTIASIVLVMNLVQLLV